MPARGALATVEIGSSGRRPQVCLQVMYLFRTNFLLITHRYILGTLLNLDRVPFAANTGALWSVSWKTLFGF